MATSLEGSPTKVKEAPSPNEVRLALLDSNPVFQYLGDDQMSEGSKNSHLTQSRIQNTVKHLR